MENQETVSEVNNTVGYDGGIQHALDCHDYNSQDGALSKKHSDCGFQAIIANSTSLSDSLRYRAHVAKSVSGRNIIA